MNSFFFTPFTLFLSDKFNHKCNMTKKNQIMF